MPKGEMLNVILHGTFAYIDSADDFIDALVPKRSEDVDHVFRAGNWLAETQLQEGTYKLEGVRTGEAHLNAESNLIFENDFPRRHLDPKTEHAKLILPRPERISSLRLAKVDFMTRPANLNGNYGAAIQVLTYYVENEQILRLQRKSDNEKEDLSGHYWEPVFTGGYANLHIFSAEDHPDDPEHTSRAFDKIAGLLGLEGVQLGSVHYVKGIQEQDLPTGVIADETEDLARRTMRMARLGRLRRQSADLSQTWHENEALDGNPDACLGLACQPSKGKRLETVS
jgi:hypothetical protein